VDAGRGRSRVTGLVVVAPGAGTASAAAVVKAGRSTLTEGETGRLAAAAGEAGLSACKSGASRRSVAAPCSPQQSDRRAVS
jgi:hypothetical protein